MSNAYVQMKAEQSTTNVSSFTTSAMTVTAGNAVVSAVTTNEYLARPVTTDSRGDAFLTKVQIFQSSPSQLCQLELATNVVGGSTTFTVTPGVSCYVSVSAQEYSGMAAAPVETTNQAADQSQTANPGTITPVSPGDLYVAVCVHNGAGNESFTPAAGWTLRGNLPLTANMPLGCIDLIGSGAQTGSILLGGAATPFWNAVVMACRAADVAAPDDGTSPNYISVDFPMSNRGFIN